MKIRQLIFYSVLAASSLTFPACNPTKKLKEGELLLDKNIIIDKYGEVDKSEMASYIKQKPNRKMLFWRAYLNIYNSINEDKLARQLQKCDAKVERKFTRKTERINKKNELRTKKGKKPKNLPVKEKVFSFCKLRTGFKQWWLGIGEAPVVFDSSLAKKSVKQIKLFLNNKGYFNSTVKDSVSKNYLLNKIENAAIKTKNKKVKSFFIVHEGIPYKFRNVSYEIKDEQLNYFVLSGASGSLITRGENYDVDVLQKERNRITEVLRNEGFYYFSKEYIYFEVDSALGSHEVDITLGIKNPVIKVEGEKSVSGGDSIRESAHERFYMNNIYIHTDYNSKLKLAPHDTLKAEDYFLLYTGKLRYKPTLITEAMYHSKGELFQQSDADQTYKRLSQLRLFRSIQIQYSKVSADKLDCHIYLSPIPKQSFTTATEGTNTSETYGVAGNITYQDNNTFKGGEIFEVKFKGALEVQKSVSTSTETSAALPGIFNTLEAGGEINLRVPRFLTPFHIEGTRSNNAKTNFSGTYNYQQRPDYFRSISNASFGYSWKETVTKSHLINPAEFNLVNVFIQSKTLENTIHQSKDLFLKNSYTKHFTLDTRYAFVFSNQDIRKQKNFSYFRFGLEGAGNALRGIFRALDLNHQPVSFVYDTVYSSNGYSLEKSYTINNIRFSQYVRGDFDYRYYKFITDKDKLVYRISFGLGKPLSNLRELPLEKSFFVGGPNSVRAWQARTLGPGAYDDLTSVNVADKIGDIKLEGNFEYRFNVVKALNAALFTDAGNIWLRKKYASYPNGEFDASKFIGQIAIGAGIGLRLDFNFFIIRLDEAFKIRDPSLISYDNSKANDPWVYTHIFERRSSLWNINYAKAHGTKYPFAVLNFGIGYPF